MPIRAELRTPSIFGSRCAACLLRGNKTKILNQLEHCLRIETLGCRESHPPGPLQIARLQGC